MGFSSMFSVFLVLLSGVVVAQPDGGTGSIYVGDGG